MKQSKSMIATFILPAVIAFIVMFLYPVCRTVFMSLFNVEGVTDSFSEWSFVGFQNYINLAGAPTFVASMKNIGKIWFFGGLIVLSLALLFAVVLSSGVKGKSFFRAVIYLPNIISAVALSTMWKQFVFVNAKYGLAQTAYKFLGLPRVNFLGTDLLFWSMLIAFCFGAIGYYMLIFLSGIEKIPADLFEAATIDGAGKGRQFFAVTLPLIKDTIKTNLTFWTIGTVTFFVWSKMFSPLGTDLSTASPMIYMYDITFGTQGNTARAAGQGAAIGVVMSLIIVLVFFIFNKLIKDDGIEY